MATMTQKEDLRGSYVRASNRAAMALYAPYRSRILPVASPGPWSNPRWRISRRGSRAPRRRPNVERGGARRCYRCGRVGLLRGRPRRRKQDLEARLRALLRDARLEDGGRLLEPPRAQHAVKP